MDAVIHDEVRHAPHEDLQLSMPRDARLLRIAHALLQKPGSPAHGKAGPLTTHCRRARCAA